MSQLVITGLNVGYSRVPVLENVSLTIPEGLITVLAGSNGAGKSTLLRTISGLLRPSAGSITFGGVDIVKLSPRGIVDLGIVHVAEGRRLFRSLTVADNLILGMHGLRLDKATEALRLEQAYGLFPLLRSRLEHRAGMLSGGQQQMLAVAQVLVRQPKFVLLDEPSLGLAPIVVEQLLSAVHNMRLAGCTVLLVEQMIERAIAVADYSVLMERGKIISSQMVRPSSDQ